MQHANSQDIQKRHLILFMLTITTALVLVGSSTLIAAGTFAISVTETSVASENGLSDRQPAYPLVSTASKCADPAGPVF